MYYVVNPLLYISYWLYNVYFSSSFYSSSFKFLRNLSCFVYLPALCIHILIDMCMFIPSIFLFQLLWWIGIHVVTFSPWYWNQRQRDNAATKWYTSNLYCFNRIAYTVRKLHWTTWKSRECAQTTVSISVSIYIFKDLRSFAFNWIHYHLVMFMGLA